MLKGGANSRQKGTRIDRRADRACGRRLEGGEMRARLEG